MRVLLVEDNKGVSDAVKKGLEELGWAVDVAEDGVDGAHLASTEPYGAVILDIMLPGLDGFEVIRHVRAKGRKVPILCLTARDTLDDRVQGLDLGADDYLVKPFKFEELVARLRAIIRRSSDTQPRDLRCADLVLDPSRHVVTRAGQEVDLTQREFALLEFLMRRSGTVVTRTAIIEGVWDMNFDSLTNVVDVFINRIRAKVDKPFDAPLIHTVRGVGYVMKEAGDA